MQQHKLTFKEALLHRLVWNAFQEMSNDINSDYDDSDFESSISNAIYPSPKSPSVVTSVNATVPVFPAKPRVITSVNSTSPRASGHLKAVSTINRFSSFHFSPTPVVPISNSSIDVSHYVRTGPVPSIANRLPDNMKCPEMLIYPQYTVPPDCNISVAYSVSPVSPSRVVPCRSLSHFPRVSPPLFEEGVVFYAYSLRCSRNQYMSQVFLNAQSILEMDPSAHIALVTNCNVPTKTASLLSVIVPVHSKDLVRKRKQWYTRMLYNGYLPFRYSFIVDTHVFPCDPNAYRDLFALFKNSSVDIAISNRMNTFSFSGGGVLSRSGPRSFRFWKNIAFSMVREQSYDDQGGIRDELRKKHRVYSFRMLSSNFFFATHGINSQGTFLGEGRCYRSSVVVTGPVRWIHGNAEHCQTMNGKNYEYAFRHRAFFKQGRCKTAVEGPTVVFSREQLAQYVSPMKPPRLNWANDTKRPATELFWSNKANCECLL